MDYDRQDKMAEDPKERIKHFKEFHTPLSKEEQELQGARCMACGVPFCQSGQMLMGMASGCPLHNLVPEWNDLIFQENWEEASIGGPFTIASNLKGVEYLLRDCRKKPEEVHRLLEIITQTQMSCIEMAAEYGMGIAMADPVANPALIGPKMYEEFVFPYTKQLTDYTVKKTGKKVSLHSRQCVRRLRQR